MESEVSGSSCNIFYRIIKPDAKGVLSNSNKITCFLLSHSQKELTLKSGGKASNLKKLSFHAHQESDFNSKEVIIPPIGRVTVEPRCG
jgi:hypothetical protein